MNKNETAVLLDQKMLSAAEGVLGSMLIDEEAVGPTLQAVTEEDFLKPEYRSVFRAIRELYGQGKPCDPILLNEYLGGDYGPLLLTLIDLTPTSANAGAYAEILRETSRLWRLREFLLAVAEDDAYDYVVIDMPPAFSLAARAALAAADEVIVPIKLDAFSVSGMAELLRQIEAIRRVNPRLTLAGVLITMWRNIDIITQAEGVLRTGSFPVFKTVIRRTDRVDESTFQCQPLRVYSPRSAACVDYRALAREYLEGRGERG